MMSYTDSTAIAGDRHALRARLRDDGFLFFRRLVDANAVLSLREDVLRALDSAGWLDPDADSTEGRPGPVTRVEGAPTYWEGYTRVQQEQRFHRLAHDPALVRLMRRLIADDLLVHPRKIARFSFPHSGFTTPPHQDYRYIQGTTDVFTAWMPLSACPPELGGLQVLQGSHTSGLLPTSAAVGAGGLTVDVREDDPDWATVDYEPGDVLVFHSLTVHGGLPNVSDRLRLSVDFRYQSASEPVTNATLRPHFHPKVPDWPDLTAAWDSLDSIAAPPGIALTGFERPDADLVPGPSKFVPLPV
jgi:hypothetical protein